MFWGANASGVLAIAFCDRELRNRPKIRIKIHQKVRRRTMRRPAHCKRALAGTLLAPEGVKRKLGRL
jgi:hypothetical protein